MYENLRNLREDFDLSQSQMAKILNIAQTTYSDYELAKINIPITILKKLALHFDTSIDFLVDFTTDRKPYKR